MFQLIYMWSMKWPTACLHTEWPLKCGLWLSWTTFLWYVAHRFKNQKTETNNSTSLANKAASLPNV